jgi:hypothetical protein
MSGPGDPAAIAKKGGDGWCGSLAEHGIRLVPRGRLDCVSEHTTSICRVSLVVPSRDWSLTQKPYYSLCRPPLSTPERRLDTGLAGLAMMTEAKPGRGR